MEVTFVRHAQTTANAEGVLQGQAQSSLTELGMSQARAAAERLDLSEYDMLEASDLGRAVDTAALLGPGFVPSPAWREIDIGAWEGMTWVEVQEEFSDDLERMRAGGEVRFGGGESLEEFADRVWGSFEDLILRMEDGQKALVVTHGGVINEMIKRACGLAVRSRRIGRSANTNFSRVRHTEGWGLASFNDAAHLPGDSPYLEERIESGDRVAMLVPDGRVPSTGSSVVEMADLSPQTVEEALGSSEHGRLTLVSDPDSIREYLTQALELEAKRLHPLDKESVSTVVFTERGPVLADFNVSLT